jgi:hypothetical protein
VKHKCIVTECAPEDAAGADKLLLSVVGSRIFVSRHKGLKGRNVAGRWMDRDQLCGADRVTEWVDVHVRRSRASSSLSEMAERDALPSAKSHPASQPMFSLSLRFCWRKRRFAGGDGDYGCFSARRYGKFVRGANHFISSRVI